MVQKELLVGLAERGSSYHYISELTRGRALRKREVVINQLLVLLGSRKFSEKILFERSGFDAYDFKRIRGFILRFFLITFLYIKIRLLLRNKPDKFLTSTKLSLRSFLCFYSFFRRLFERFIFLGGLKRRLLNLRYLNRTRYLDLYDIFTSYVSNFKHRFSDHKYIDRFNEKNGEIEGYSSLKNFTYGRYSFVNNVKSKRVARFLAKIAFVFKRTKRSLYYKLLKPFKFPFRIGTKATNFYLKHKANRKTVSYNDYRSLKLFFGSLKPEIFWRESRAANTKDVLGWSFLKKYSYLDFRLDHFLGRVGFANNMFEGKNLIDDRKIKINGTIVQTNGTLLRPYDWIEVVEKERFSFKLNYLSKLVIQRTQHYNLKPLPSFIEINWGVFRFFILPPITLNDMVRPYKTFNYHVGGGKKQPAKLA